MNFPAGRAPTGALRFRAAVIATVAGALLSSPASGVAVAADTDPILVYSGNTSMSPSQAYKAFGAAAERPISSTTTMPSSLVGNACVLLNLNQAAFNTTQVATLSTYLAAGGRVLMIGENGNFVSNTAFRGLATSLGSSLQIQNNTLDSGYRDTLNIDADPLTRDVVKVNYAAAASVTFGAPARSLVRTSGGGSTFMAVEKIGAGELFAFGDWGVAQSVSTDHHRLFVANMCGSRRVTASVVDCDPASALVGGTVTCTATVTDIADGMPDTPTGQVVFSRGGTGAGTFAADECTLVPTGTSGEASCTVGYLASEAGEQTLTARFGGTIKSYGSTGSDAHAATLPPPPVATDGDTTAPYGESPTFQVVVPANSTITLLDAGQPTMSVSFPGEGVYALDALTGIITFTAAEGFSGTAQAAVFRLTDGYGQTDDASFVARVAAAPTAPEPEPTVVPTPAAAPTPLETAPAPLAAAPAPPVAAPTTPTRAPAACVSRRVMKVNFRLPTRAKVRRLRVTVAGEGRRVSMRSRRVTVDLRGTRPRSVRVLIRATVAGGRTLSAVRTYRTCTAARTTSAPGTLYLRITPRSS